MVLGPGQARLRQRAQLVQLELGPLVWEPRQALLASSVPLVCGRVILRPPRRPPVLNARWEPFLPTLKQPQCRLVSTVLLEDGPALVLERVHLALLEHTLLRPVPHQVRRA